VRAKAAIGTNKLEFSALMAGKPGFIGTGDVLVTAGQSGRAQN